MSSVASLITTLPPFALSSMSSSASNTMLPVASTVKAFSVPLTSIVNAPCVVSS